MSEEAYKTAWRELREWLEETIHSSDIDTFSTQDEWYKGYGAAVRHTRNKLQELEKSHDLD